MEHLGSCLFVTITAIFYVGKNSDFLSSDKKENVEKKVSSGVCVSKLFPTDVMIDIVESIDGINYDLSSQTVDFGKSLSSKSLVVMFGVPGAFTPTCSSKHLPSFIKHSKAFYDLGVDDIYCFSLNDKFVMKYWGMSTENCASSRIKLVADSWGKYTHAMGLHGDFSTLGVRCKRFAAVVESGVCTYLVIDESGYEKSTPENIISFLKSRI